MPVLKRFDNFVIRMYFRDENPPHVHVVGKSFEARVAIRTRAIIDGEMPAKVRRRSLSWIVAHSAFLLKQWEIMQS